MWEGDPCPSSMIELRLPDKEVLPNVQCSIAELLAGALQPLELKKRLHNVGGTQKVAKCSGCEARSIGVFTGIVVETLPQFLVITLRRQMTLSCGNDEDPPTFLGSFADFTPVHPSPVIACRRDAHQSPLLLYRLEAVIISHRTLHESHVYDGRVNARLFETCIPQVIQIVRDNDMYFSQRLREASTEDDKKLVREAHNFSKKLFTDIIASVTSLYSSNTTGHYTILIRAPHVQLPETSNLHMSATRSFPLDEENFYHFDDILPANGKRVSYMTEAAAMKLASTCGVMFRYNQVQLTPMQLKVQIADENVLRGVLPLPEITEVRSGYGTHFCDPRNENEWNELNALSLAQPSRPECKGWKVYDAGAAAQAVLREGKAGRDSLLNSAAWMQALSARYESKKVLGGSNKTAIAVD